MKNIIKDERGPRPEIGLFVSFFYCGQQRRSVWGEDKPVLCQVAIFDAKFLKDFQTLAVPSLKKETFVVICSNVLL